MNRPNWPAGVGIGDRFASRDQVLERGRKGATGLAQLGVQPGDRIAFLMHNDISFFEAWAAARRDGKEVVRTEIGPDGRIVLVHKPDAALAPADAAFEAWKAKRDAHPA